MLIKGADLSLGDYDGRTPLHLAASEGRGDIVSHFLGAGLTDINPIDRWGNTPLDDARRGEFDDVVKLLAGKGGKLGTELK